MGADRPHRGGRPGGAGDLVGAATRECHILAGAGDVGGRGRRDGPDAVRANADESLLNLAAKAHGNPFLVRELVGGLREEGRLKVSGGRAVATGDGLPRRLSAGMQQRLDLLSDGAGEVVRVAAVLPDRFSAGLLAAMLERQPASLMSALEEAVRADLLVEDGEQLRFRHDLLREATRQSLPQSLRRAMERQSASVMLGMGAAPAEVATQLARSAEPGDREAIGALRQAAQAVGQSDASAAADLSKRALELMPTDDAEHGRVVAETVGLLNRASRYEESEELAVAALSEAASAEEEAEIRLRLPAITRHSTQRRVEENRRALELSDISEVTRARHLALLAYNLMLDDKVGNSARRPRRRPRQRNRPVISRRRSWPMSHLLVSTVRRVRRPRAAQPRGALRARPHERCARGSSVGRELLREPAGGGRPAGRRGGAGRRRTAQARRERNAMALDIWATIDGMVHLAAGRLTAARAAVESLPPPSRRRDRAGHGAHGDSGRGGDAHR